MISELVRDYVRLQELTRLPKCYYDECEPRFEHKLARIKAQLLGWIDSMRLSKALRDRLREIVRSSFEDCARRSWQGYVQYYLSAVRTESKFCGILKGLLSRGGAMYEDFGKCRKQAADEIEQAVRGSGEEPAERWWRDPAFWAATLEAALTVLLTLVAGAVGAAAGRLALQPRTAELIIAAFWDRANAGEFDKVFSPWVERRMEELAQQLSLPV